MMTSADALFYMGIDGGGSKTHAILVNDAGSIVDEVYTGAANISSDVQRAHASITAAIEMLLAKHGIVASQIKIGVGVAGFSSVANREQLLYWLQQRFFNVKIAADCHIACLAAHGKNNGGIVICGTGVVGYTIDNGISRQFGGWGFPHGDFGGAAWFGLQLANRLCIMLDGMIAPTPVITKLFEDNFNGDKSSYKNWLAQARAYDFAKLAASILSYSHFFSDYYIKQLIQDGANYLRQLLVVMKESSPKLEIKLAGGLADIYLPVLKTYFPQLATSLVSPAFGGYLLWVI